MCFCQDPESLELLTSQAAGEAGNDGWKARGLRQMVVQVPVFRCSLRQPKARSEGCGSAWEVLPNLVSPAPGPMPHTP